ncbi:hypothetical protein GNI_102560 [Gregarina niphandrodes]|uniref:Uncharacterized protein n=1 Tax=Gregarina niphandrodes TaxID=110365 RepID=A0A023B4B4_GRENI|nr:hypothetical protein GNI_102560 [Gregarina niphandrodes]EZG56639.1 hypothetical protein GNI_102560 [Gregarina niphandrodes]|eukprot:XP_011131219.1 hypothetical protein GNI_102560 [Gregarina niphandrodes]
MVQVTFNVILAPPRGVDFVLLVLGECVELLGFRFGGDALYEERHITRALNVSIMKFGLQLATEDNGGGKEDGSDDSSEDNFGGQEERRVRDDITVQRRFFDKHGIALYPDSQGLNVANLWSSPEPLNIVSLGPGRQFQFTYAVWDLRKKELMSTERFPEPRQFIIPPLPDASLIYDIMSGNYKSHQNERVCKRFIPAPQHTYHPYEDSDDEIVIRPTARFQMNSAHIRKNHKYVDSDDEDQDDEF